MCTMWAESVHDRLKSAGYRSTRTRDVVIDFLVKQRYVFSVDMISEVTSVDPVTIYRVLDVLQELGVVYKLQSVTNYCTVPQSLWSELHKIIMIDQLNQKIHMKPYDGVSDGFIPERVVVELRGKKQDMQKENEKKNQINELNVSDPMPLKNQEESDIGAEDSINEADDISSDEVDRLHRF